MAQQKECEDRVRANITKVFNEIDTSGDGFLDELEFCRLMKHICPNDTTQQHHDLFHEIDRKASRIHQQRPDGKISLEEFITYFMGLKSRKEIRHCDLRGLFKQYDKNGNGLLDLSEFITLGKDAGYDMTEEHFKKCCGSKGKIDVDDFLAVFSDA